jgi:ribonuclease HII
MRSADRLVPTLRWERRLLRSGCHLVAGMDEVGRGALAGPVSVGVVAVHPHTRSAPVGTRDSKLLTPDARTALVPLLRDWAHAWAVGHAGPEEIDAWGIVTALRMAGRRALADLGQQCDCVLLDGSHDWLTDPAGEQLLDLPSSATAPRILLGIEPTVRTVVKGDQQCAAVAAASVLAKVERDAHMVELARRHPGYGWQRNKGYTSTEHVAGLREHGPSPLHRRSWRLPTQ